jgi:hypothetical protein
MSNDAERRSDTMVDGMMADMATSIFIMSVCIALYILSGPRVRWGSVGLGLKNTSLCLGYQLPIQPDGLAWPIWARLGSAHGRAGHSTGHMVS